MVSEAFATGDSLIHRLDPRRRVVLAVAYAVVVALSYHLPVLCGALVVSIVLAGLARLNLRQVARRLAVVAGFLALLWLVLPFTYEGDPMFSLGPLKVTRPGLLLAAQISLKSIAMLLSFIALLATMSIVTLGHALHQLRMPEKLVQLLLMTYRYVFLIEGEYRRLWTAIKIRGFRSGTNLHSYKTYAYLIGMLFVRASERARRVNQSMRCRCFSGRFYSLEAVHGNGRGLVFTVVLSLVIVGLAAWEFTV